MSKIKIILAIIVIAFSLSSCIGPRYGYHHHHEHDGFEHHEGEHDEHR
jgi:PBP1b-binding outer membrane lipoprotein LpoB